MRDRTEIVMDLRRRLEGAFRADTASEGFCGNTPSAGHCGAVTAIVHEMLGGEMVSTLVDGRSHWINRIDLDGERMDVDLTGDQFGAAPVRVGRPGELYPGLRVRTPNEVTAETWKRALLLAERSGLTEIARALKERLATASTCSHSRRA